MYVGHYSEWRYLENVGRGRSVEIDVQKDQGLRRESRGRERREKENRAAEGGGREEGIQKGGKERRTTSRVTSCRLPRVFSSSTSTPPSLFVSSSSIISTSVPSQASTYLLSPKSFCFLRRRGMRGIVQLDSTRRWSFLATLPILVHANVSSNSNEDFFVYRFIEYTILIRVRFRIWRKVQFIIRTFWTNALLSVKIRKKKIIIRQRLRNIRFKDDRSRCLILRDERGNGETLGPFLEARSRPNLEVKALKACKDR